MESATKGGSSAASANGAVGLSEEPLKEKRGEEKIEKKGKGKGA